MLNASLWGKGGGRPRGPRDDSVTASVSSPSWDMLVDSRADYAGVLKEGEAGVPVTELLRQHGISRSTYFIWRSKYAGTTVAELRRIKERKAGNTKLSR